MGRPWWQLKLAGCLLKELHFSSSMHSESAWGPSTRIIRNKIALKKTTLTHFSADFQDIANWFEFSRPVLE
jgi:hypothetical protein